MLPVENIYSDSRHNTYDSNSSSDFKIDVPVNSALPANTAFYATDITAPSVGTPLKLEGLMLSTSAPMVPHPLPLNDPSLREATPARVLPMLWLMY